VPDALAFPVVCSRFASIVRSHEEVIWEAIFLKKWKTAVQLTPIAAAAAAANVPPLVFTPPPGFSFKWVSKCLMLNAGTNPTHTGLGFISVPSSMSIYFGELESGRPHGDRGFHLAFGTDSFVTQFGLLFSCYGKWKNGFMHGEGTCLWTQGDKYCGQFVNGYREGVGIYTFASGNRYEGEWFQNSIQGRGIKYFKSGNMYEGNWSQGKHEGFGKFIWNDNSKYHGDSYEGEWSEDRKHGFGKTSTIFGSIYIGHYDQGRRIGKGKIIHPDGTEWEGEWDEDVPSDLEAAYHPKMKEAIATGKCTSSLTGHTPFFGQVMFQCAKCHPDQKADKKQYVCLNCFNRCHSNHGGHKRKFWTCGRSFCSCFCASHKSSDANDKCHNGNA